MMKNWRQFLETKKRAGLYRSLNINEGRTHIYRKIDGHKVVSFCSNDYLGLASDTRVIKAFQDGANTYGVGSGAAALINGRSIAHDTLEKSLAELVQRERALLFSTGYMANLGTINALTLRGDMVLEDRYNHASLIDAASLTQARCKRYQHLDMEVLEKLLIQSSNTETNTIVVSDAIFSMDGDIAALKLLAKLCSQHNAFLLIDDAHGFGVYGKHGAGSLIQHDLTQTDVHLMVGTFGKACGTFGAFVAGSNDLIETLIQKARTYIYTTAPPPAIACATLESLRLIKTEAWRQDKLHENITLYKNLIQEAGLPLSTSQTAIQPLIVGSAVHAQQLSEKLLHHGIQVTAIRPPTVPKDMSRLRICLSSQHEAQDIKQLVVVLKKLLADIH